ncbi:MAG: hypothetical protein ACXW3T_14100, partial [Rhodoplanes sp.]
MNQKYARHCEKAKPTKQSSEGSSGSPRRFAARDDVVGFLVHQHKHKPFYRPVHLGGGCLATKASMPAAASSVIMLQVIASLAAV